jgi:RimJ/RimL family protein N-acetyltransferase
MPVVIATLAVPAADNRSALLLRPWLATDMSALLAEMDREYPTRGIWPNRSCRADRRTWTGPRDELEAAEWLAGQDRGWRDGDWLTFAVLEQVPSVDGHALVGHVALRSSEPGERVSEVEMIEVGYWTASGARGRGVAPAALQAVTAWAFDSLGAGRLRRIKLVHQLDNHASCRVAEKSGYAFQEISPARPPLWFAEAHVHIRSCG